MVMTFSFFAFTTLTNLLIWSFIASISINLNNFWVMFLSSICFVRVLKDHGDNKNIFYASYFFINIILIWVACYIVTIYIKNPWVLLNAVVVSFMIFSDNK
jgi:hypothetical protein